MNKKDLDQIKKNLFDRLDFYDLYVMQQCLLHSEVCTRHIILKNKNTNFDYLNVKNLFLKKINRLFNSVCFDEIFIYQNSIKKPMSKVLLELKLTDVKEELEKNKLRIV